MGKLSELWRRARMLFRRERLSREMEEEMLAHRELRERELREAGASPEEAQFAAGRRFGNALQIRERGRDMWGWSWLEDFFKDARFGTRMLRKNPGFTAVAILTIAIGIGASSTIFSWMRTVLLNPLPGAAEPERVLAMETMTPSWEWTPVSYLDFRDIRDNTKCFESMSVTQPIALAVGDETRIERIWGEVVSGTFFDLLRVRPERGRFFLPAESGDEQNAHPVVVISHSLWATHYHSDPQIAGTIIHINKFPYTVIGVAPEDFHGSMPGLDFQMWTPATMYGQLTSTGDWMLQDRKTRMFRVLTRLAPGVNADQARAEVKAIAKRMSDANTYEDGGMSDTLLPIWKSHYGIQEFLLAPLGILMAACGVVLLIVCANVANLLLARATSRQREFSVRCALGASRSRLIRQLLTETFQIAMGGAALGLLFAVWLSGALRWIVPASQTPNVQQPPIDMGVLLFTAVLAFVVVALAGIAPALQAARGNVNETLKQGGRSGLRGGQSQKLRGLLVTSEVALAVITIISAGLFMKSFQLASRIRPGFDPNYVAIIRMDLTAAGYNRNQTDAYSQRLREQLEKQPGVTAVTYADWVPLGISEGSWEDLKIEGYVPQASENMKIHRNLVAPGYFSLMKIPLLEGRDFNLRDDHESQPVMIVTREFLRRFLLNQTAIGRKVYGWGKWFTIVGVAEDSKIHRLTETNSPYFYVPIRQIFRPEMGLRFFVRTEGPMSQTLAAMRAESQAIDPAVPVFGGMSLNDFIGTSLFSEKISASLLSVLGSIALLLAAIGLYSVMAYLVAQRTNEIGIRMALGARPRDVLRLILRQGMMFVLPGLVVGSLAALALARVAAAALVAVSPSDPVIYGLAALFTIGIALVSMAIPARRAMRVDPMVALRFE